MSHHAHSGLKLVLAGLMLGGSAPPPGTSNDGFRSPVFEIEIADAAQDGGDPIAALERVSDEELAEQRGGFAFNGMEISLGAEIRTFFGDQLVLQTNVSWTPEGATTTQIVSGALTPADATMLQAGLLSSGGITMRVGDDAVYLANDGATALIHRTENGLQNVLINTASNVDIRQEVDATLGLQGYEGFRTEMIGSRVGEGLGAMIGDATIAGLGN